MKTWDLKLYGCYAEVYYGPDNDRRGELFAKLVTEYTADKSKKNLQVGVNHAEKGTYGDNWVCLDAYDQRDFIEVREKLECTTLPDNTFDLIVCNAILEHVEDPFGCARSMYRIAKPGCRVWCEVPFVQPFHPHKNWKLGDPMIEIDAQDMRNDDNHGGDYWRYTPQGIVKLMHPFRHLEILLCNEGGIVYYGQKPTTP